MASAANGQLLREDTGVTIRLGPFLDKTDRVSPVNSLTAADIENSLKISKNGAAFANRDSGTDPVFDFAGWYSLELNANDTNTP